MSPIRKVVTMRAYGCAILLAGVMIASSASVQAASLQVSPVNIEVQAPGAAAILKLRNEGTTPINAQIRVFRWTQTNGLERLEPATDGGARPRTAALAAKTDYTVRLVRVSKQPVASGESYRLM